ncbi:unnamed protein product [Paramecium primaurelia]|nr:unnamed protein product [Paramecium primaurelia]
MQISIAVANSAIGSNYIKNRPQFSYQSRAYIQIDEKQDWASFQIIRTSKQLWKIFKHTNNANLWDFRFRTYSEQNMNDQCVIRAKSYSFALHQITPVSQTIPVENLSLQN